MSGNLEFQSNISIENEVTSLKSKVETSPTSNNIITDEFISFNDNDIKSNIDNKSVCLTDDIKNTKISSVESSSSGSIHAESQEFVEANSSFEHDDEERFAFKDINDNTTRQQQTASNITLQPLNKIQETTKTIIESSQSDQISEDKNIISTNELLNEQSNYGSKIVNNSENEINLCSKHQTDIFNRDDYVQFPEKISVKASIEISNNIQIDDSKTNRNQSEKSLSNNVEIEEEETEYDNEEDEEDEESNDGLDDDENKNNPAYIPRGGQFYMHDLRANVDTNNTISEDSSSYGAANDESTLDIITAKTGENEITSETQTFNQTIVGVHQRVSRADRKWEHDLYNDRLQRPKTTKELMRIYGKDIRKEKLPKYTTTDSHKLKENTSKRAKKNVIGEKSVENGDFETMSRFNDKYRTRASILRQQPQKTKAIERCQKKGNPIEEEQRRVLQTTVNDRRRQRQQPSNQLHALNEREIRKLPLRSVIQQQKQSGTHGNSFRRTITSTRYSSQAKNASNVRRQTPENYCRQASSNYYEYRKYKVNELSTNGDYAATNEATENANIDSIISTQQFGTTSNALSGHSGGKRYTTQRHGNMRANFTASSSTTQKLPDIHAQNQQQRTTSVPQSQFKHNYKPSYYHGSNRTRGRKYIQNRKDYDLCGKQEYCYGQSQYHHHSIGPEMLESIQNNYEHPPPNLTQHNRNYMENYPPLGAQIDYHQQSIQLAPQMYIHNSGNQHLRQPTSTVYFDTTQQQQQCSNAANSVSLANLHGNQMREKRRLPIAEPDK